MHHMHHIMHIIVSSISSSNTSTQEGSVVGAAVHGGGGGSIETVETNGVSSMKYHHFVWRCAEGGEGTGNRYIHR